MKKQSNIELVKEEFKLGIKELKYLPYISLDNTELTIQFRIN